MLSPFLSWCATQGIITPLTLCGEETSYRYMKIDNHSLSGDILRIPLKACIIDKTPELLSQKLAKERDMGDESIFAPYINVLPTLDVSENGDYIGPLSCMPRFWDEKRIEVVSDADGGQLERKLIEDKRNGLDPWAHACVTSRANYVLGHGYAMTPILDMINHDSSISTSARVDEEDELYLSSSTSFSAGSEVFISYGELTNLETLCSYGFVSSKNEHNKESIDVIMIRKAPVKVTFSCIDGSIDENSLAILRSFLATPAELDNTKFFDKPISDNNEEEVFSLIASYLQEAIEDAARGVNKLKGQDELLEKYLSSRVSTLEKGLTFVNTKFPCLEY